MRHRLLEVIIDDGIIENLRCREFPVHECHPPLNHGFFIRAASSETLLEDLETRRQEKDQTRTGTAIADLGCPLNLDFENDIMTELERLFDCLPTRAVGIPTVFRVFEKTIRFAKFAKLLVAHEMIVDAIFLTRSGLSSGMRNGEP
jgi:hypothetical protein